MFEFAFTARLNYSKYTLILLYLSTITVYGLYARIDAWLEEQGYKVMRISNRDVKTNLDSVLQTIYSMLGNS